MNRLVSALHVATHHVPGVRAHGETTTVQRHHRNGADRRLHHGSPRLHSPNRHHQNPPRVLIAWQNRIGRLVGHSDHR